MKNSQRLYLLSRTKHSFKFNSQSRNEKKFSSENPTSDYRNTGTRKRFQIEDCAKVLNKILAKFFQGGCGIFRFWRFRKIPSFLREVHTVGRTMLIMF